MAARIAEKVERYERLLAEALDAAEPTGGGDAVAVERMARSYLDDGRHFVDEGDLVNALAAFSYGHGWLDAGARIGLLDGPDEGDLFSV